MIEVALLALLLVGDIAVFGAAAKASRDLAKEQESTKTVTPMFGGAMIVTLFAGFPFYILWAEPHFGLDPIWRLAYPLVIVLLFGLIALFLISRGVQLYVTVERRNV